MSSPSFNVSAAACTREGSRIPGGIQSRLDYGDAVAAWFAGLGAARIAQGALEDGLKYTHIAASLLCRQNRTLSSPKLEANLLKVAAGLPGCRSPRPGKAATTAPRSVCLHVISEALPAGGLTAMPTRWILNDRSACRHHAALLSQHAPVPDALVRAVRLAGGEVHMANPEDSFVARAAWLRNLADDLAGHVVLHVDVSDVISGAAFGVPGGPCVLLVNHTAHLHWIGASAADLIVNCRGSALEGLWMERHRAVPRHATVPIPIPEPAPRVPADGRNPEAKRHAREMTGVPNDAVVILTVGALFKYQPVGDIDFVKTCGRIIEKLPEAVVLAVGFEADERWAAASRRAGSRIRVLGRLSQEELATLHAASDIYIEGFPFGTTTALLESGSCGLPVVLAPAVCPPPFGSDGVALDEVMKRPDTVEDYEREIVRLGKCAASREHEGEKIRRAIAAHHAGPGWQRHLDGALDALPAGHRVHPLPEPQRTPEAIHEYWFRFQNQWASPYEQTLENAVQTAYAAGLKPRLDANVLRACRKAAAIRANRSIPVPLLRLLCNGILPVLPARRRGEVFRLAAFLFRESLCGRLGQRMRFWHRETPPSYLPYEEYRRTPGMISPKPHAPPSRAGDALVEPQGIRTTAPKVSFVVPCHNLAHLLPECVNSILSQSYADFEVLIMDDCSPDETAAVARSFSDPRIQHIRNETNLGPVANFNKGIRMSRGKYVWLISADDYLRRSCLLQRYVGLMEEDPRVGFTFCPGVVVRNGREAGELDYSKYGSRDRVVDGRTLLRTLLKFSFILAPSVMSRRECFDDISYYPGNVTWAGRTVDMTWAGDWYLWCMFALHWHAGYFAEPMICYREHDLSISDKFIRENINNCFLADVAVPWMVRERALQMGLSGLARHCLRMVADEYARQIVSKQYRGRRAAITMAQYEESLAGNAATPGEKRGIDARVHEAVGDRRYSRGDHEAAASLYRQSLAIDPWLLSARVKGLLLGSGARGSHLRKTFRQWRGLVGQPR